METGLVHVFARTLVLGTMIVAAVLVVYKDDLFAGLFPPALIVLSSLYGVVAFLYPASVFYTRTQEKSYQFLQSWWHYLAIAITLFYWVTFLI